MIAADDPRHGTRAGYRAGCTEPCCENGRREYLRTYGQAYREQYLGILPKVDAAPVLEHLAHLMRHATVGEIAHAAGVRDQAVRYLVNEPPATVRQATRDRLMALTPADLITRLGLTRRVRALTAIGWSVKALARQSGLSKDTIKQLRDGEPSPVWGRIRDDVLNMYERLHMSAPEAEARSERAAVTRARNLAARNGWPPPLAWECIDDPYEVPAVPANQGPHRVDLDEFMHLIRGGESVDRATARLGVTISAIEQAARRNARPDIAELVAAERYHQRKAAA